MKPPLTYQIVMLLLESEMGMHSSMIARKLEASRDAVQRALPNLVTRGLVSRVKVRGGYARYTVSVEQSDAYRSRYERRLTPKFSAMPEDAIARKLKFLEAVSRGVFGESPVLAEIIADFHELRRRQAEAESA